MTNSSLTSVYDIPELDRYYADCVIGGPGAFMIPVNDWSQFPEAVRRKLELELAGPTPPLWATEEAASPPALLTQGNAVSGQRLVAVSGGVRRKLELELAGPTPPLSAAKEAASPPRRCDCLIGEKLWGGRFDTWDNQ